MLLLAISQVAKALVLVAKSRGLGSWCCTEPDVHLSNLLGKVRPEYDPGDAQPVRFDVEGRANTRLIYMRLANGEYNVISTFSCYS